MARRRTHAREPYQEYRSRLQARWRPHILARDRSRCRACGSKEDLEMAHLTDCVAFARAVGRKEGVTFSFRWDNLVTLCAVCHALSHAHRVHRDELDRRVHILRFLESLRKLRGWHSPYAVLPPELVPEKLRPFRSFHDCIRLTPLVPFPTFARYAADGGLVFEDLEAPPQQSKLPRQDGPAPEPDPLALPPAVPTLLLGPAPPRPVPA
jgi:hypothetical protein